MITMSGIVTMSIVGLMVISLSLYACIIGDNLHYLQVSRRRSSEDVDRASVTMTAILALVVLVYDFYVIPPAGPLSVEIWLELASQLFFIVLGIILYRRLGALRSAIRHPPVETFLNLDPAGSGLVDHK
jgi:Na+/proline symporter